MSFPQMSTPPSKPTSPHSERTSHSKKTRDESSVTHVTHEKKCRGCDFNKKSLRGHLVRTSKPCKELYSRDELKVLEEQSDMIHKSNTSKWRKANSKTVNEQKRQRYHKDGTSHIKTAAKKKEFVCSICDKMFATKADPFTLQIC